MNLPKSSIDAVILGSGAWGRALAFTLSRNDKKVLVQFRNKKPSKKEFDLPNIEFVNDISEITSLSKPIIISTPVSSLESIGGILKNNNILNIPILLTCKGIESKSGLFPTEVMSKYIDINNLAVMSGPSFAAEVLKNKPTAVTLAAQNEKVLKIFSKLFHHKYFRVYEAKDMLGCQIGGAMKNILSVAVGISDGLELGSNAKAALITRGMVEIKQVGGALNCNEKTISGLSGIGDLVLTANDNQSRNRRFGIEIARGISVEDAEAKIGQVVEGINASKGLQLLAKKYNLNLPICNKVFDIINGVIDPKSAVNDLLVREQKQEFI